ncbi:hypothetical protein NW767_012534 [Fusarium falciforme]|uniref:Uncharacterized protein n=1 Tax=Fusarium falciforme TaxID=195108 RepID=A0A9W8QZ00_9HYPO|nr:hypothetical protein NW755_011509 [Fusarium falciforme]KAJ4186692.1 hypothetical protein NW767_012534 [Fusarium falciforme]
MASFRQLAVMIGGAAMCCIAAIGMALSSASPPKPETRLLSPYALICRSHKRIARLHVATPEKPVTLFSVLHLDHSTPPFHLADDCAYPASPNYKAARRAISETWAGVTDEHDGNMREWRDAFADAALTLLNDTSRAIYMKDVLPKMEAAKGNPDKVCLDICAKL